MPIQFECPATYIIAGPTMSGKTFFTKRLIEHRQDLFKIPPTRIVCAYGAWQPLYDELSKEGVEFHQGLPTAEHIKEWTEDQAHTLILMDDIMQLACSSPDVVTAFTVLAHHRMASIVLICQSVFPNGTCAREISLNAAYFILFRSKRDRLQMETLGRQVFPRQSKFFSQVIDDVMAEQWGYLVLDLHPATDRKFSLRSHIFPGENLVFYTPIKDGETSTPFTFEA